MDAFKKIVRLRGAPPETLEMLDDTSLPSPPAKFSKVWIIFIGVGVVCLIATLAIWQDRSKPLEDHHTKPSKTPESIIHPTPISPKPLIVYFEGQSVEPPAAGLQDLQLFFAAIKGRRGKLVLEGYAASSGSGEVNRKLSEDRVKNLARIFMNLGMDPVIRVYKIAYGGIISQDHEDALANQLANNRVEIRFVP